MGKVAFRRAPLCPAGHFPHEGGDWMSRWLSPIANVEERALSGKLPISPKWGDAKYWQREGRTEGAPRNATEKKLVACAT